MAKQYWTCEKCQALYETEEDAKKCETYHYDIVKVKGALYVKRGLDPFKLPTAVMIELKDEKGDYVTAIYKFDRVGDRAVASDLIV